MKLLLRFLLLLCVLLSGYSPLHAHKYEDRSNHHHALVPQSTVHYSQVADQYNLPVIRSFPTNTGKSLLKAEAPDTQSEDEDEDDKQVSKKQLENSHYLTSASYRPFSPFRCSRSRAYSSSRKHLAYASASRYLLLGVILI